MKTIKVMSIIGIIWFFLMFLGVAKSDGNRDALASVASMSALYGLAFAIVDLVTANKNLKN